MKKRRITRSLAAAVMAASILGGCGSSNTQSTTGTCRYCEDREDALKEGAQGMSKHVSQEMSEAASGKDYCSTFDVAGAGDLTLDVMITSLGDSDGGP
ncbi:MAG: hypothetical protein ACLR0U_32605 [Enterocloster clostridioformis]